MVSESLGGYKSDILLGEGMNGSLCLCQRVVNTEEPMGSTYTRARSTTAQKNTLMLVYFAARHSIKHRVLENKRQFSSRGREHVLHGETLRRVSGSLSAPMTVTSPPCNTQVDQHRVSSHRLFTQRAQHAASPTETTPTQFKLGTGQIYRL